MPNRACIDAYERINTRTKKHDFTVVISDDFYDTTLVFAEKNDVPDNDMELLKLLMELQHDEDNEHGTSCDVISDILGHAWQNQLGILIGGTLYSWDDVKEILSEIVNDSE